MMSSLSESFIEINVGGYPKSSSKGGGVRRRPAYEIVELFVVVFAGAWSIYHYQCQVLPEPLTLEEAGKTGFSEVEAIKHVNALTQWGPHTLGSDALELALQYVRNVSEDIKKSAHEEVEVEVDFFSPKPGLNRPGSTHYVGKSMVYSDIHHVVLRISPKSVSSSSKEDAANGTAILVSAHVDTVFSADGAGDDTSNVAVMLELARVLSQLAHGFKHSIVFLFNTAEEEGLNGSHSFITQHPWRDTLKWVINLEAMGVGGKSGIFQVGPHPWAIENFAKAAKYPSGQITSQDLFSSGVIQSSTDFEIYRDLGGLSGLDFAFQDRTAVYHTKNDKVELLTPGSLQHLGENVLPFLIEAASSTDFPGGKIMNSDHNSTEETAIFFDILGKYMIVFRQHYAQMVYELVVLVSFLIGASSLNMGGLPAFVSLILSCLSLIFMWIGSIAFASLVAFILPSISKSPVPFIASPWLVLGLYGSPALMGALMGQHAGFLLLRTYLSSIVKIATAELESERWIFKAGLLQWLILLMLGAHYKIGSTYLPLVWLASPAVAYILIEASLSSKQSPRPLNPLTLVVGLFLPFLLTSGVVFMLMSTVIGYSVRYDSNPGSTPEWLMHILVAVVTAAIVCLTLVYLLSYVHISGAKSAIILASLILLSLSVGAVFTGLVPGFTDDTSRAVNVVHVVDASGTHASKQEPHSFISLFSTTPGKMDKVAEEIGGLTCGTDKTIDFVTFSVTYSCWADEGIIKSYKPESHIPTLIQNHINHTIIEVSMDMKSSTRWAIGINTNEVKDVQLKDDSGVIIVPNNGMSSRNGWHIIEFSGGKNSPTKFKLTLFRVQEKEGSAESKEQQLLKLRTDHSILTPEFEQIFSKLPSWCAPYGKSVFPHTLAFLTGLPVPMEDF